MRKLATEAQRICLFVLARLDLEAKGAKPELMGIHDAQRRVHRHPTGWASLQANSPSKTLPKFSALHDSLLILHFCPVGLRLLTQA